MPNNLEERPKSRYLPLVEEAIKRGDSEPGFWVPKMKYLKVISEAYEKLHKKTRNLIQSNFDSIFDEWLVNTWAMYYDSCNQKFYKLNIAGELQECHFDDEVEPKNNIEKREDAWLMETVTVMNLMREKDLYLQKAIKEITNPEEIKIHKASNAMHYLSAIALRYEKKMKERKDK